MSDIIKIVASFSGGRTSAEMTQKLIKRYNCVPINVFGSKGKPKYTYHVGKRTNGKEVHILVVMANTGRERNETLLFSKECDYLFGLGLNYVEAVVNNGRTGTTHKIVKYAQLSKNGEPYRAVISKYGIPNVVYIHCTRELKQRPINSFVKSIGWYNYLTAIGYRIDEPKRFAKRKPGQIYPLVFCYPMTKQDVLNEWNKRPFDLRLEEHQGNCDLCFKKHTPKLLLHIHELITTGRKNVIEWWRKQEKDFENYTPETRSACNPPYRFFRGNISLDDLVRMSNEFYKTGDEENNKSILLRQNGEDKSDCEESCEPFN